MVAGKRWHRNPASWCRAVTVKQTDWVVQVMVVSTQLFVVVKY